MQRTLPLLALVIVASVPAQDCTPELTSTVSPMGAFGSTLAGQGQLLAVGAPDADAPLGTVGTHPYGRVELFQYDPAMPSWRPAGVLAPPPSPLTVVNNPGFASSLALDGETLLCGWPNDITGGNGTVRSFRRTSGGWVDEAPLLPPFASATGRFGVAVAIDGDRCAITEALSGGLVHVFERAPATGEWTFRQTLASPGGINSTFGRALALFGEWLFVGDPGHVGSLHGAGQLEVFRLVGGAWQHHQTVVPPGSNPLTADLFGFSLAFEVDQRHFDNRALYVGAPQGQGVGAVHELRWRGTSSTWEVTQTLSGPGHLGAATFGWSVDRTGEALLVGAPGDSIGPALTGAAYLLERDPVADSFSFNGRFMAQGAFGTPLPEAGASVAVAGWHAAFGAPGVERVRVVPALPHRDVDADNATDACEARFQLASCWLLPNSTGRVGRIHVDGSVAVQAGNLQLAADQLSAQSFGYFILSQTNQLVLPPGGLGQILCISGSIGRFAGPGQVLNSGAGGQVQLTIDPRQLPQPNGPVAAVPGETWYFQYWHRDVGTLGATSVFTETARVRFE